ncbi:hypothetical protein ACH4E8_03865 [Streptomyces sp. NPDC017979]|uniref:hypothetical protein n=1 Tax=Streptomyces sp. NPDC017979 TaxID=3365024 RepID=UPI0037ABDDA2
MTAQEAPPTAPGAPAAERRVCAALATLPLQLIVLTQDLWPDPPAHPIQIVTGLRCALEEHDDGPHFDLVRELDDHDGDGSGGIWAHWENGIEPSCVKIRQDCSMDNGEPGAANDACTLFAEHPGGHSHEFSDPEYEAVLTDPEFVHLSAEFEVPTARSPDSA